MGDGVQEHSVAQSSIIEVDHPILPRATTPYVVVDISPSKEGGSQPGIDRSKAMAYRAGIGEPLARGITSGGAFSSIRDFRI